MGQGDSNFSSEEEIVENFKLETPTSVGHWPGACIIYSQSFLAAKQYDGLVLWTSALDQMVLYKISQIYLLSSEGY